MVNNKNNKTIKATNQRSTIYDLRSQIDIKHVAKLANLTLTQKEEKLFTPQLSGVINFISKLNEVNTEGIEPTAHAVDLKNVSREDEAAPSLSQEDALKNTSRKHNGFFEVPAIFEEQDT